MNDSMNGAEPVQVLDVVFVLRAGIKLTGQEATLRATTRVALSSLAPSHQQNTHEGLGLHFSAVKRCTAGHTKVVVAGIGCFAGGAKCVLGGRCRRQSRYAWLDSRQRGGGEWLFEA